MFTGEARFGWARWWGGTSMLTQTTRNLSSAVIVLLVVLDGPGQTFAGMPMVLLSDLARMRFQTISFFLLVLLGCSWIIQIIWNALHRDFPGIPRLDFKRAVGLVIIWGLLFVLVLTMISGARELMTPGAWKKEGFTYALAGEPEDHDRTAEGKSLVESNGTAELSDSDASRREALDRLRIVLWKYALAHESHFPSSTSVPEIPEKAWQIADPSGLHFVYRPGLKADEAALPLAYEPGLFGAERWSLLTDGTLKKLPISAIKSMEATEKASPRDQTKSEPRDW
jgi:hypothetical protein